MNKIRFRIYLLTSTGLIVFASTFNYSLFNFAIDKLFPNLFYLSYYKLWELCLIIAAYLLFTSGVLLTWQYRQMLIAKRESVQNELSALKAQINPHFLFNNLNTIYGMALQQDYRTPDAILQLSDFLRYVLYDTSSDFIELAKEVEILDTYISLQKERINPLITKVEWVAEGNFENVMIAPLLLLPLAENCFKYGKGRQKGKIVISLRFDGRKLTFETENNIARCDKPNGVKSSGLGIHNVVKRLNLIYPGKFVLTYYETEGIFKLEMCIELARS